MSPPATRAQLDERLNDLGYEVTRDDASCDHPREVEWAVYYQPDPDCLDHPVDSYGDIGWSRVDGCRDCVEEFGEALFCGGLYLNIRIFEGDRDVTDDYNLLTDALKHPSTPLS